MFINSDKITVEQLYNGEISKENINTSGRKVVWENSLRWFYKGKEMIGSGTGRLQTYFYAEAIGWQRGGQVHNDFNLYLIKKKAANAIAVPMISVRYTQIRQGRANSIV